MHDHRATVESVFRNESGRIIAGLIRVSHSFDLAEEAMQDAFAAAVVSWQADGVPDNPAAWITATARRKRIDFKLDFISIDRQVDDPAHHGEPIGFANSQSAGAL